MVWHLVPLHNCWYQTQAIRVCILYQLLQNNKKRVLHEQVEARLTQQDTIEADQATHVLHEQIEARLTQGATVEADKAHFAAAISGVAGAAL